MTDEPGDIRAIRIEDEMRDSYLDYAMSVIVARVRTSATAEAGPSPDPLHDGRDGLVVDELVPQVRRDRRRSDGQVPPAQRDVRLYDALVRLAQDFSVVLHVLGSVA